MGYNSDDWSYPVPVQFVEILEMLWIKAFGSNRYRAWEIFTTSGESPLSRRRHSARGLCRNDAALDDLVDLDYLLRLISAMIDGNEDFRLLLDEDELKRLKKKHKDVV